MFSSHTTSVSSPPNNPISTYFFPYKIMYHLFKFWVHFTMCMPLGSSTVALLTIQKLHPWRNVSLFGSNYQLPIGNPCVEFPSPDFLTLLYFSLELLACTLLPLPH